MLFFTIHSDNESGGKRSEGSPIERFTAIRLLRCEVQFLLLRSKFVTLSLRQIVVKKQKDFPLPYMLQILFCQSCCQGTVVVQTLASWFAIVFMQLIAFHLTFIFLAFVASPVQTISTLLLFVTGIFSGISITTLFLAAFQKRNIPIMTLKESRAWLVPTCSSPSISFSSFAF